MDDRGAIAAEQHLAVVRNALLDAGSGPGTASWAAAAAWSGLSRFTLLDSNPVFLGLAARLAAATNSVIVTLPSFSAFLTHLPEAQFDWMMLALTSITAVIGAQMGARFMARRVKSLTLSRIFALALILLAVQRAYLLRT